MHLCLLAIEQFISYNSHNCYAVILTEWIQLKNNFTTVTKVFLARHCIPSVIKMCMKYVFLQSHTLQKLNC